MRENDITKNPKSQKKTYQFGVSCENIAQNFLKSQGYSILQNRYKTKYGEVDLIVKDSKTLVFVEVKARKKDELIEVILRQKQIERIKNSAQYFLSQNLQYQDFDVRFDFILFTNSLIPLHHKNYF